MSERQPGADAGPALLALREASLRLHDADPREGTDRSGTDRSGTDSGGTADLVAEAERFDALQEALVAVLDELDRT